MSEQRAGQLEVGMTFKEYGMDDRITIDRIGYHGDAVLIWAKDGMETTLDSDTVVEVFPSDKMVPDFLLDFEGKYYGNAYPESIALRVTIEPSGDEFHLAVEDTGGSQISMMVLDAALVDGIQKVAMTDHSLDAYGDDWKFPNGMEREVHWDVCNDMTYGARLNEAQIAEVRDWLQYATGEDEWDWDNQGTEWTS